MRSKCGRVFSFFAPYIWNVVHFRVSVFRVLEKKEESPPPYFSSSSLFSSLFKERERESESERSAFLSLSL